MSSLFLTGVLLFTPVVSRALTIYDNLGQPQLGSDTVSATAWDANKLVTDGTSYTLSSITLRLSSVNTTAALQVLLYSDSSNNPGALLVTLGSTSAIGGSASDITFNPLGVTLAANTSYWVVTRSSGSGDYRWYLPDNQTGSGVAFNTAFSRSNNGGSSWALGGSTAPPYYLQVQADVPEPSSVLLGGLGLAMLGLAVRRRS